MRVRAGPRAKRGWFAEGECAVLGIEFSPTRGVLFRVEEESTPSLFAVGEVVLTDGRIPLGWTARVREGGGMDIYPAEWQSDDFWPSFFDQDPDARNKYERVKASVEEASR
jgi:hypothetical protein